MAKKLTGEYIKKDCKKIISERCTWDGLYNEVRHWFKPEAADFNMGKGSSEGQAVARHIFNPAGRIYAERLANILYSTVMPVHSQFFSLVPPLETNEVMKGRWQKASEKTAQRMAESNLAAVSVETLRSLVYFGTPIVYSFYENKKLNFQLLNPENTFIKLDYNRDPFVVLSRRLETAENVVNKFGNKCSDKLRESAENGKGTKEVTIFNYFYRDGIGDDAKWLLYVVEDATSHIIEYYSFASQPIHIARTNVSSWETYSRSFAMDALDSVIDLNTVEKTVRRQAEKHVDPPLAMPFDSSMAAVSLAWDTNPGGIVEVMADAAGAVTLPQPLALGGDLSVGQYQIDKNEQQLKQIFLLDVLTAILEASEQATATQINEMAGEKLDLVVPIIVSLINDFVKKMVARCFQLLLDNGEIDMGPDESELNYDVEVQSSLIMKLRALKLNSGLATVGVVANMSAYDPSVLDTINFPRLAEEFVLSSTMPTSAIRVGQELIDYRDAKAQQQQAQMAQAQMAEAMQGVAKNIDPNVKINPQSIAGQLTGAMGRG